MSTLARVSRQVLQRALLDSPFGVGVCDEQGRIVAISTSMAQLLRRPAGEIIGRPFLTFVHPDERAASIAHYFEAVAAVAAGVRDGYAVLRCLAGDGETIRLRVSWTISDPDQFGVRCGIVYLDEISEPAHRPGHSAAPMCAQTGTSADRRSTSTACGVHPRAEHRPVGVAACADEIVWELDPTGAITFISAEVERYLGYQPIELIGQRWQAIMPSSEHRRCQLLLRTSATGAARWESETYVFTHKTGQLQPLRCSGQAHLGKRRALTGFAGTLRPVDTGDHARRDHPLREQIQHIIDRRQIRPVFQPIVDLSRRAPVAVEALSRFPAWLAHTPAQLFADAAALGLATELDLAALEAALADAHRLPTELGLALNASPQTILSDRLPTLIAQSGLDPTRIIIEITAQVPIHAHPALLAACIRIRSHGCSLAVDHADADYGSFKHIAALTPELIKLDRFLVTDLNVDHARRALLTSIVTFAGILGADIVAKGVETEAQTTALQDLGIHYGQGYHLGQPLPISDLIR
jgi:PAS domain S-box-containing protein